MDLWEDDLFDDDFSDEEEELEDLPEDDALELSEDGFADWADSSDGAPEDERLEEALAEERTLELESELEQDVSGSGKWPMIPLSAQNLLS